MRGVGWFVRSLVGSLVGVGVLLRVGSLVGCVIVWRWLVGVVVVWWCGGGGVICGLWVLLLRILFYSCWRVVGVQLSQLRGHYSGKLCSGSAVLIHKNF